MSCHIETAVYFGSWSPAVSMLQMVSSMGMCTGVMVKLCPFVMAGLCFGGILGVSTPVSGM